MRRLTGTGAAVVAAAAMFAGGAVSGCAVSGAGVRVEGEPVSATPPATVEPSPRASVPPTGGDGTGSALTGGRGDDRTMYKENGEIRQDGETAVISVMRKDPKVSGPVKKALKPCLDDLYPVSVTYARVTHGYEWDLVVNVTSCEDGVGVGTYVYRRSTNGSLINVFAAERPPVRAEIDRNGFLVVTREKFISNEPKCCPSGRDIVTYAWQEGVFHEVARKRTDSTEADGDDDGSDVTGDTGGAGGEGSTSKPAPRGGREKD